MRDSKSPKEPTPLLWIDFSKVVGSSMLKLDDFSSSTVMNPFIAFELVDEDLVNKAKQPAQPLNEVCIKPQSSGHESLMLILADLR